MINNAEAAVVKALCDNINTDASYVLKRKFGTTLQAQQDIQVYNAFYRVCPTGNAETQFIPREASFLLATMFYKYRNKHEVHTHMKFEDALHQGYAACKSETSRRTFERMLSHTPGIPSFNRMIAQVCSLMERSCDLSAIDYAALLYDIGHWNRDRNIARRWSRVMHQYTPDSEIAECESLDNNE